ncbi:MAG: hypothetical protein A4E30_00982 [Methanomassiliicoccales archaeon PtaB.Bin215]|nr:MAG: hypothetical protein A4E30_00982 [Methanomassiliicoccales archaeon PtaB.Bin215]
MTEYGCAKDCLTPQERKKILSRIHSLLFWVGENVPDTEELDGRKVPLRDVVFRFITEQQPSEDTVLSAHELARALESKARSLEKDLRLQPMERETAYRVMHEALGLLRAVDELRDLKLEDRNVKARELMTKVSDEKRWLTFLQKVR